MTSSTGTAADADRALKAKHRSMWALGDYPGLAADLLPELGHVLVEACGVGAGNRVLDIAAGSGNAAIPAAQAGATVIASDLTPELFDAGRARAADEGVDLEWREADAEALPFADGEFDVVISCLGVMFAPHHQAAADELVRVCRPGGRIGLLSWTPEGFIGQLFATMKPFAPPPPPGASPPPKWGSEEHVLGLLGDRVTDVVPERRLLTVDHFARPVDLREYFKAKYGPTIAVYRSLADEPERAESLDADLLDLARRSDRGTDSTVVDWEYLLLTATKKRETVPSPR
jgi:SAM-dependent methyltransferase